MRCSKPLIMFVSFHWLHSSMFSLFCARKPSFASSITDVPRQEKDLDLLVTFFLIQSRTLLALCTDSSLSRARPPRLPELPPQSCLPTIQYPACTAAWVYFFPGSLLPQVSGAWDSYKQILPLKTEIKKTLSTSSPSTSFITRSTAPFSHGLLFAADVLVESFSVAIQMQV